MSLGSVYVASPLGFTQAGDRYRREVLNPALVAAGFTVLDPWDDPDGSAAAVLSLARSDPGRPQALRALNQQLGAHSRALLNSADAVFAVLDGSDVDSGTAAEIGFASARGCPVIGLRTDLRTGGDNEEAPVNLQVLDFIEASGGSFERDLAAAVVALVRVGEARSERFIYHLAERTHYLRAVEVGEYRRSTRDADLDEIGFIHTSFRRQLAGTAARHYADVPDDDLVLLEIDRTRLAPSLRLEQAPGRGELFPHIYGALNLDAVVSVRLGRPAIERSVGGFPLRS